MNMLTLLCIIILIIMVVCFGTVITGLLPILLTLAPFLMIDALIIKKIIKKIKK